MIIFDCDGVLVDSEIITFAVDAELMREAGYDTTPEALIARYIGWKKDDIYADVARRRGTDWPEGLVDRAHSAMLERLRAALEPVEGVTDALRRIKAPKAVASSARPEKLALVLGRCALSEYFGGRVFSAQQVARGKPAPDIFLFAAERSDRTPDQCIVVEDSVAGVIAARAAKMRVIGFTGGRHSYPGHADHLSGAGAHRIVGHMRDLPEALAALGSNSLIADDARDSGSSRSSHA